MSSYGEGRLTRRGFTVLAAGSMASSTSVVAQRAHGSAAALPEVSIVEGSPLVRLLSRVPASLLETEPVPSPVWSYTDFDQQKSTFGLPSLVDDERAFTVTRSIYMRSQMFSYWHYSDFVSAIGFDVQSVQQFMQVGGGQLYLITGDMPLESLPGVWESAGYSRVTIGDSNVAWTLGDDLDFAHPIQGYVMTDCNNVTITGDGVIVFSRELAVLELVYQETDASLLSNSAIAGLVAQLPSRVVGCEAITGASYSRDGFLSGLLTNPNVSESAKERIAEVLESIEMTMLESDRVVGPLPEWSYMITGVLAGTVFRDEETEFRAVGGAVCRMSVSDPVAAQKVAEVIAYRWQHGGAAFTDLAEIARATTVGEVAVLDFSPVQNLETFTSLPYQADVWPFLHGESSPQE